MQPVPWRKREGATAGTVEDVGKSEVQLFVHERKFVVRQQNVSKGLDPLITSLSAA